MAAGTRCRFAGRRGGPERSSATREVAPGLGCHTAAVVVSGRRGRAGRTRKVGGGTRRENSEELVVGWTEIVRMGDGTVEKSVPRKDSARRTNHGGDSAAMTRDLALA